MVLTHGVYGQVYTVCVPAPFGFCRAIVVVRGRRRGGPRARGTKSRSGQLTRHFATTLAEWPDSRRLHRRRYAREPRERARSALHVPAASGRGTIVPLPASADMERAPTGRGALRHNRAPVSPVASTRTMSSGHDRSVTGPLALPGGPLTFTRPPQPAPTPASRITPQGSRQHGRPTLATSSAVTSGVCHTPGAAGKSASTEPRRDREHIGRGPDRVRHPRGAPPTS